MVFRTHGGDKRDRTADLLNAIQALSQLSYTPIFDHPVGQLLYYTILAGNVKHFFAIFCFSLIAEGILQIQEISASISLDFTV